MDDETRQRLEALEATLGGFPVALGELGRAVTFPSTAANKRLALELPGRSLVISSQANNHWGVNCRLDGSNWMRYDTSKGAYLLYIDQNDGVLRYLTAAAGANPISWTTSVLVLTADSGWVDVGSYAASYSAYDPVSFRPQFRKLASGMVIFRGLIKKSVDIVANENMFTMPAGFRNGDANGTLLPMSNAAGYMEARVLSSGAVNTGGIIGVAGGNAFISLGAISFYAEN